MANHRCKINTRHAAKSRKRLLLVYFFSPSWGFSVPNFKGPLDVHADNHDPLEQHLQRHGPQGPAEDSFKKKIAQEIVVIVD